MLKLLADENFDNTILRGLLRRQPDIDIIRVQDTELSGANDRIDWFMLFCLLITQGNGRLTQDSVALCFQLHVLDKTRLVYKLGQLDSEIISQLEEVVLLTLGYEQ
jgi:PemK-like, MazF-like toxin of type II toxin-antitoxin system